MVAHGAWEPFWPFCIGIEVGDYQVRQYLWNLSCEKKAVLFFRANYELSTFSEGGFLSLGPPNQQLLPTDYSRSSYSTIGYPLAHLLPSLVSISIFVSPLHLRC